MLVVAPLLAMTACENTPQPADIEESDMCSYCRMAISEKRYAAEAADIDGNVYKFDNPMCMARFIAERGLKSRIAVYYIAGYDTRSWLDARTAAYAKSPEIPSPMASGLAAFGDAVKARQFATAHHGQTVGFEDLWTFAQ